MHMYMHMHYMISRSYTIFMFFLISPWFAV